MKIKMELEIGKKKISLSPDEMKELYDVLKKVVGEESVRYIPYYPYYPTYPYQWSWTTYTTDDANGAITISDSTSTQGELCNA